MTNVSIDKTLKTGGYEEIVKSAKRIRRVSQHHNGARTDSDALGSDGDTESDQDYYPPSNRTEPTDSETENNDLDKPLISIECMPEKETKKMKNETVQKNPSTVNDIPEFVNASVAVAVHLPKESESKPVKKKYIRKTKRGD